MFKKFKYLAAIFFTILFMALICAPSIILSFDDSADVSSFYSINEEEEKEIVKLVFNNTLDKYDSSFEDKAINQLIGYTFRQYPDPFLNVIFPPPDFI